MINSNFSLKNVIVKQYSYINDCKKCLALVSVVNTNETGTSPLVSNFEKMGSFFKKIFGDDEARVSGVTTGTPLPPPTGSSPGAEENKDSWKVQLQRISQLVGQVEENTRDGFKTMVYPMQRTDKVKILKWVIRKDYI